MRTVAASQSADGKKELSLRAEEHITSVVQSDLAGVDSSPTSSTHCTARVVWLVSTAFKHVGCTRRVY